MPSDLSRIRRYLQTQDIRIRWMPAESGYTLPDLEEIHVNPAWEIARVLIHEAFHHLHPDWNEARVETETIVVFDMLTPKQVRGLAQRCHGITWTEEGANEDP